MANQSSIVNRSCAPATTVINSVPNPTNIAPSNLYPGRGPARVNTQSDPRMQATMSKAAFPEYVLPSGNTL